MKAKIVIKLQTIEAVVEDQIDLTSADGRSSLFDIYSFLVGLEQMFTKTATQKEDAESETFQVESVTVSNVDGRMQIRLHGGRFAKYGVPLYHDSASLDSSFAEWLTLVSKKAGTHTPLSDYIAQVQLVGGKPKRVQSVTRSS